MAKGLHNKVLCMFAGDAGRAGEGRVAQARARGGRRRVRRGAEGHGRHQRGREGVHIPGARACSMSLQCDMPTCVQGPLERTAPAGCVHEVPLMYRWRLHGPEVHVGSCMHIGRLLCKCRCWRRCWHAPGRPRCTAGWHGRWGAAWGEYLLQQAQWVLQVEGPQDTTSFSLLSCPARHACKSGSS